MRVLQRNKLESPIHDTVARPLTQDAPWHVGTPLKLNGSKHCDKHFNHDKDQSEIHYGCNSNRWQHYNHIILTSLVDICAMAPYCEATAFNFVLISPYFFCYSCCGLSTVGYIKRNYNTIQYKKCQHSDELI